MKTKFKAGRNRIVSLFLVFAMVAMIIPVMNGTSSASELIVPLNAVGDGLTLATAFEISQDNISWFNTYANSIQGRDKYYKLVGNITLDSSVNNWTAIGSISLPFIGSFDGCGFAIRNLNINQPTLTHIGMFGAIGTSGVVKNITLSNCNVLGNGRVGGITGENAGTVSNCQVTGNISTMQSEVVAGGIVGLNEPYAVITNCFFSGEVSGAVELGGIVGANFGTTSFCIAMGNIYGTGYHVGGIVGIGNGGYVINCVALNSVVRGGNEVSVGRVGGNGGTRTNNYARSDLDVFLGTSLKTINSGLTTIDGLSVTSTQFSDTTWWYNTAGFTDSWWVGRIPTAYYIYETEHFIFDSSLQNYLPANISPEIFNKFMSRMDLGYKAMLELIGQAPSNGEKIILRHMDICGNYNGLQHAHGNTRYICWNPDWIQYILTSIRNNNANEWWFEGTMHELGHIFQDNAGSRWNFASEGTASYIAWLAVEKCNGSFNVSGGSVSGIGKIKAVQSDLSPHFQNLGTPRSFLDNHQDDIVFFVDPVFDHFGFDNAWEILKKVFRSYYDGSYQAKNYTGGTQKARQAVDFFDRCSYFMNMNIEDLWDSVTLQRYLEVTSTVITL